MQVNQHGGYCCGAGHISGFDRATPQDLDQCIREFEDNYGAGDNRLIEVILSERQVTTGRMPAGRGGLADQISEETRQAGGWAAVLRERGFKLVTRFNNSNSEQNCYVFHRIRNEMSLNNRQLPFDWPDAEGGRRAAAVQAQREPVQVLAEYLAVFADGRERGPFTSLDELRRAYPRVQRYVRRVVMSDGTVNRSEIRRTNRG